MSRQRNPSDNLPTHCLKLTSKQIKQPSQFYSFLSHTYGINTQQVSPRSAGDASHPENLFFPWSCQLVSDSGAGSNSAGCVETHMQWKEYKLLSPAQITEVEKRGKNMNHLWNRQQGEPLPCSTPSSVNYSYSACAVVYSFPAVKGCPLKVPFVHRLHFVIQIAPIFFRNGLR